MNELYGFDDAEALEYNSCIDGNMYVRSDDSDFDIDESCENG